MSREPGCLGKLKPKYRPSEAVIEEYGHWEAPDEAEAREAYLKTHVHHGVFGLRCPIKDLAEFGEGVQLYFMLLKTLAILFCVLALLPGLPLLAFCGIGGWYDEADLERTMLGNYGLLTHDGAGSALNLTTSGSASRSVSQEGSVTALFAATADATPARLGGMDKRRLLVAMSALDLVGVVVFFLYGVGAMWYVRRLPPASGPSSTTIAEYSVRVDRLPYDTAAAALKDYLIAAAGEGVEVVEVELCRRVDDLLALVVERGRMVNQSELALAVVQRKAEVFRHVPEHLIVELLCNRFQVEGLTAAIRQEQSATKTNEVVTAFVTFSTHDDRQRVLRALPRSLVKQWRMKPEAKFNNGGIGDARIKPVALDVSPAPEPSDIQYQNLEYTRMERLARSIATNTAKLLVLLLGFLLVSLAPAMRLGIAGLDAGPSKSTCAASCTYTDGAGNYVLTDDNRSLYKQCDSKAGSGALPNKLDCEAAAVCYECFCRAALNAGMYGEVVYCSRFSSVMGIYTLAQALAVLGVVLANFLIEIAITWLVRQEKHHTRTNEAVGITRGLFMTTLANTAFSNLVANMYLPGPADFISGSFLSGYIFTGSFADTTPNWYHDVCRPITISLFLTTVISHAKVAFRWWWRRRCLASRYQCLTQWQLEEAYEGHEFDLALKYGQHLYVTYVVMAYSAGVPLMYVLGAVHFVTCYWCEKYELLRLCQRPLAYSRRLAAYFSSSLPFATLWHLAFGVWFYSLFGMPKSPLIARAFRRSLEASVAAFEGLMPVASALTPQLVAWRFTQNSSAHLFLAFIACGGLLFIYFTTSTWLSLMRGLAKQLGLVSGVEGDGPAGAGEAASRTAVPEFSSAVRSQLLIGPASYAVQQNPGYTHAFVRMEEIQWDARKEDDANAAADALAYNPLTSLAAADPTAQAAASSQAPGGWRKRTAANKLRARQKAAAAMSVQSPETAAAQVPVSKPVAGNKVYPQSLTPADSVAAAAPPPLRPPLQQLPPWQRPPSSGDFLSGDGAKEGRESMASAPSQQQRLVEQPTFVGQRAPKVQPTQPTQPAQPTQKQPGSPPRPSEGQTGQPAREWGGLDFG